MTTMSPPVVHLAMREDWEAAISSGLYPWSTRGMTIAQVGYMHCAFTHQVAGVRERFYADVDAADMVQLTMDVRYLEEHGFRFKIERAVPNDPDSESFPHMYGGDMPVAGVASVEDVR